jgi:glyoxylase I family protein
MERVTGIGGVFFRARDPEALKRWYEQHLGVTAPQPTYGEESWWQEQGPTVIAPFRMDSGFFGRPEQQWSINFRVRDLDAIVNQLRDAGIKAEIDPEVYPNGRFGSTADPEGNPIQLWEPTPEELVPPQ